MDSELIRRKDVLSKVVGGGEFAFIPAEKIREIPAVEAVAITGETSDGYHTFNELYHHRALLFSVICNDRPDMAWKSRKHHDGTMYDGMFIVGIQTPEGSATYHYDIDPYWPMFNVPELEQAPVWDGHTPAQAIERIGRLAIISRLAAERPEVVRAEWRDPDGDGIIVCCTNCNHPDDWRTPYCPHCGARMDADASERGKGGRLSDQGQ